VCFCVNVLTGARVYMLYDVPNMIKNVRNNLLSYDFVVDGDVVSFKYLRQMFEEEQGSWDWHQS